MKTGRTTLSIQVDPEVKQRLEVLAGDIRWDVSAVVREMIDRMLPEYERAVVEARTERR